MATTTVIKSYVDESLYLIDSKKTGSKFCYTCNKRFTRTRYFKHIESKNHSPKAGESSRPEIWKKSLYWKKQANL